MFFLSWVFVGRAGRSGRKTKVAWAGPGSLRKGGAFYLFSAVSVFSAWLIGVGCRLGWLWRA